MVTLEGLKRAGKIEHNFEDDILQTYLDAAVEFLDMSGIKKIETSAYDTAVYWIAMIYFENRDGLANLKQMPFGITMMIEQLRNSYDNEE